MRLLQAESESFVLGTSWRSKQIAQERAQPRASNMK
jgi:hypothetical protein